MMKPLLKSNLSSVIDVTNQSFVEDSIQIDPFPQENFYVAIANTRLERMKAYQLAYQEYLSKGYVDPIPHQMLINSYDAYDDTAVFNIYSFDNKLAGSVTLVFKENGEMLPCESNYQMEINQLLTQSKKISEVSRFVISNEFKNQKKVLIHLLNYIFIYSRYIKKCDTSVIQVNPRHVAFYEKLLKFDVLGDERRCSSVNGAPAILMELPLSVYEEEIEKNHLANDTQRRSLYQYFISKELENLAANYLIDQFKPMSFDDKIFFGLDGLEVDLSFDECLTI